MSGKFFLWFLNWLIIIRRLRGDDVHPLALINKCMKKWILTIFAVVLIQSTMAESYLKCQVNECFELTSIAFRLADALEYINQTIPTYSDDIDHYFAHHKDHKLIAYIKELRKNKGVAFDAVALASAYLEISRGVVRANSKFNISEIGTLDNRWDETSFNTFVSLLNDFYKKSKFRLFFDQHADLYSIATKRMDDLLSTINANWFQSFFGSKIEETLVIASLCNGSNNYAFKVNNNSGIVIGAGCDSKGLPAYNPRQSFVVIHELLHHRINPLISKYWLPLEDASTQIYSYVKDNMAKIAYGSARIMTTEWMINLCTLLYFQEEPNTQMPIGSMIRSQQVAGFVWMERSFNFMQHFYDNRDQFTTLESFIPQLIEFLNYSARNFDHIQAEFIKQKPYVVDVFPSPGSVLPQGIDTIEIRFSAPMLGASGMSVLKEEGVLSIPIVGLPYWKDEFTFVIPLDRKSIMANKLYGFSLPFRFFQSDKYYSIGDDFRYTFNTYEK